MWWRKRKPEAAASPNQFSAAKANAWSKVAAHYAEMRQRQGLLWNRANHVDLQNFFLDRHEELRREFPREYGGLERSLVEEDFAKCKAGSPPLSQPVSLDITGKNESEQRAACWDQLLIVYCRIHARLKVELRTWNEKEFQEFESALLDLRKVPQEPTAIATAS